MQVFPRPESGRWSRLHRACRGLRHAESLAHAPWPGWDESLLAEDTVTVVPQVDGRVRGRVDAPRGSADADVLAAARAAVRHHLDGRPVRREVVVPDRVVNLVL